MVRATVMVMVRVTVQPNLVRLHHPLIQLPSNLACSLQVALLPNNQNRVRVRVGVRVRGGITSDDFTLHFL